MADDSGLAVDALNGMPGVLSARWCGRHGDDRANLDLVLGQLADVPDERRGAAFVCAAALVQPDGAEVVAHGEWRGRLVRAPRGTGGFGYDPIFVPDGRQPDLGRARPRREGRHVPPRPGPARAPPAPAGVCRQRAPGGAPVGPRYRRSVTWRRVVAAVGLVAAALVAVLLARTTDLAAVQQAVRSAGLWAPAVFVLLQVAVTVAPVPRTVFTVAAGVLFGSSTGVLLAVAATTATAVLAFWLVRIATRQLVERHAGRAGVAWVRDRLEQRGLLAVVSLRLIPVVPFSAMNYASGLSGVPFAPYLLGTVLGVLPGTVAVVVLGEAAVGGTPHPALLAVSVAGGLLGLAGAVVAARGTSRAVPAAGFEPALSRT